MLSKRTICRRRRYANFKRGQTTTENAERPGRPIEVVTHENMHAILKIVMSDSNVKFQEIASILKTSKSTVFKIVYEN